MNVLGTGHFLGFVHLKYPHSLHCSLSNRFPSNSGGKNSLLYFCVPSIKLPSRHSGRLLIVPRDHITLLSDLAFARALRTPGASSLIAFQLSPEILTVLGGLLSPELKSLEHILPELLQAWYYGIVQLPH